MYELLRREFVFRFVRRNFRDFRRGISEMILLLQLTVKNRSLFREMKLWIESE